MCQEFESPYVVHTDWVVTGVSHTTRLLARGDSPPHFFVVVVNKHTRNCLENAPAIAPPSVLPWPVSRQRVGLLYHVEIVLYNNITCVHRYGLFLIYKSNNTAPF